MKQQKLELEEVYDIWTEPFYKTGVGRFLIFVIVLLFCFVIFFIFKKFFKKKEIPFWLKLRNELKKLIDLYQKNKSSVEKTYEQLTKIIKKYFHLKYGFPTGLTDAELIENFNNINLDDELKVKVISVLERAELIKFSNYIESTYIEKDLQDTLLLIEKTTDLGKS